MATVALPGLPADGFGAAGTTPRTVVHSYAVAPAPGAGLQPAGGLSVRCLRPITTTVDLLGRTVSTQDAYGAPTADHPNRVTYDQAGRAITSGGPSGRLGAGPVLPVSSYSTSGELTAVGYSATHTTGKTMDVRLSAAAVETFHRHRRVASHLRAHTPGHTADPARMPDSHRHHAGGNDSLN